MDDSAFDAATQRLSSLLTRRRSLSVLVAAGLGAGLLADEGEAKKKKGKKGKKGKGNKGNKGNQGIQPPVIPCTDCTVCETCVNGACQPVADNTSCGSGAVCRHGACGKTCAEFVDGQCPAGTGCGRSALPGQTNVCTMISDDQCAQSACTSDANCSRGMICANRLCNGGISSKLVCRQVA
jgi:hypothetical protein